MPKALTSMKPPKLNGFQIETILDRMVPMIATKEDEEFFRGVIGIQLEAMTSPQAAKFVAGLLAR